MGVGGPRGDRAPVPRSGELVETGRRDVCPNKNARATAFPFKSRHAIAGRSLGGPAATRRKAGRDPRGLAVSGSIDIGDPGRADRPPQGTVHRGPLVRTQVAGLGPEPRPGSSTGRRGLVGENSLVEAFRHRETSRLSVETGRRRKAARPTQFGEGRNDRRMTPCRAYICAWR